MLFASSKLARSLLALGAGLAVLAAGPAAWATPLSDYLAAHPRAEVLPAPYFEPGLSPESYLELEVRPYRFLPHGTPWRAEVDTGRVARYPEDGTSTERGWTAFLALGDRAIPRAELRLYARERSGAERLAARVAIPTIRPERFNAVYQRGPRSRQLSSLWGEEGIWLVLLQMRHPARFWRVDQPVLYLGGDFLYQKIEHIVRFLRVHGVNALGYKPDYGRDQDESVLALARSDYPHVRRLLELAAPAQPAHLVGMCLGAVHGRALIDEERKRRDPLRFQSLAGVGTPHMGSELADLYNSHWIWPFLHRFSTGDPNMHRYKDSRPDMAEFNRRVPPSPGVPYYDVVLDPGVQRVDPRYDSMVWALQRIVAAETGVPIESVRSDGLITLDCQVFGQRLATWQSDHAGMINDGRASTYFDAHRAHMELVQALQRRASKGTP